MEKLSASEQSVFETYACEQSEKLALGYPMVDLHQSILNELEFRGDQKH